jgi:hypothetical protein
MNRLRNLSIKFALRIEVNKEKLKRPSKRDNDKIANYESLLISPEILEYIEYELEDGFIAIENEFSSSELGDGKLLERFMKYLFEEDGFKKIIELIVTLIGLFA